MSGTDLDNRPGPGWLFAQRCSVCGRPEVYDYCVSKECWESVVPSELKGIICLTCFDYFASAKNIDWIPHLHDEVHFVGVKGSFVAQVRQKTKADV